MHLSFKGFFLLLLISSILVVTSANTFAEDELVVANAIGFESTSIIEFENTGDKDLKTFRMWLGSDFSFKSFKTENGWTGKKTPEGVVVFTTQDVIKPGESVKFGIKTNKAEPGINWKALDDKGNVIRNAKTLVSESTNTIAENVEKNDVNEKDSEDLPGVVEESVFRLVPEKPNVGSNVRVTGNDFTANKELDFYIGDKKFESFETDANGQFMITTKIPKDLTSERIDFIIKDKQGNQKSKSLRISEVEDRQTPVEQIKLTISKTPDVIYRGELIKVSGTATPSSTVTATIKDEAGSTLTTIVVDVGPNGRWAYETLVALDAKLGKQSAEITDGATSILRTFTVESPNKIQINPTKLIFEPGDTISLNGTAIPDKELEIVVEDPTGAEFFATLLNIDSSGKVDIQFPTDQSSIEGTYVVFATQEDENQVILVGLGELPRVEIIAKMNKLNYKASETAIISIDGEASSRISLLIVDPSDKDKFSDSVTLGADGHLDYELDLQGYSSGVYTFVLKRANSQFSDVFSVGLQTGSGQIDATTTKDTYVGSDSILILGNSNPNILLTVTLEDPQKEVVKTVETFTDKDGVFSTLLKLPINSDAGTWNIRVKSGPNFTDIPITVAGDIQEGMVIRLDRAGAEYSNGDYVTILGEGAQRSQNLLISIWDSAGEEVFTFAGIPSTGDGSFQTIWQIPSDISPGIYTVKVKDSTSEAETSFKII